MTLARPDAPALRSRIVAADKRHVWHPYTAMDDWIANGDPIVAARAEGARIYDVDGRSYLDGNASWWTAALGHNHPRLLEALQKQASRMCHVALAGITHESAALLAEELVGVAPHGLSRVFYTDNGSTALELAVKMSLQYWVHTDRPQKRKFAALDGAFHGETLGATALGGVELFRRPFAGVLFDCVHVPVPTQPDAYEAAFGALRALVERDHETLAAIVVEPLVQGAIGMRMYPAQYLRELTELCRHYDVHVVFDEVFTGFGRTGSMWASTCAGVSPDMLCLGKAFAQALPLGAVLTSDRIFDAFRGGKRMALLYGHTYCGHPLATAVAREVLAVFRDESVLAQVFESAKRLRAGFLALASEPGVVRVRSMGMVAALDLEHPMETTEGYLSEIGWRVYAEARARGAYMRPLGNTIYVCPALVISPADLDELVAIVQESVRAVLRR
jgi:adenosylmethionine-8-amino-7-oxononanoate aminotransferase